MITVILSVFKFLWKYKEYVAGTIIIFAIYSFGYLQGKDNERARCTEAINKIYKDLEDARKKAQAEIDKRALEYEHNRAARESNSREINQKVQDEKRNNTIYATCRVSPVIVQQYQKLSGKPAS